MDVSALKVNKSVSYGVSTKKTTKKQPSFSGLNKAAVDIATIGKDLPIAQKALLGAEKLKGEFINAIITAFGTACVAPIFITYNPFSKEDKETRKYSAWRQPISAVIQFVVTLAILKPFDKFMHKQACEGKFTDANLKSVPTDSYLKGIIKKEHPEYTPVQINEEIAKRKVVAFNEAVEQAKQTYSGETISDDALLGKKELDDTLERLRKAEDKPLKGLKGDAIHAKVAEETKKSVMKRINATADAFDEIIQGKHGNNVESILGKLEGELSEIIEEINKTPKNPDSAAKALLKEKSARRKILESVIEQLEILKPIDGLSKIKQEFGSKHSEIIHSMKVRQLVKASGENAKHVFERLKLWSGMGVALLVLPVACCTLNYVYPRLMEKIMPEVAKKKKMAQQPQNSEAKKEVKA